MAAGLQSAGVSGRTLREVRLVLQGAAAEVRARLSTEMPYTASLDACIANAEGTGGV